jgi:hypothetical protein
VCENRISRKKRAIGSPGTMLSVVDVSSSIS